MKNNSPASNLSKANTTENSCQAKTRLLNVFFKIVNIHSRQRLLPPKRPLFFRASCAGKWGEVKSKRAEPGKSGNESALGTLGRRMERLFRISSTIHQRSFCECEKERFSVTTLSTAPFTLTLFEYYTENVTSIRSITEQVLLFEYLRYNLKLSTKFFKQN